MLAMFRILFPVVFGLLVSVQSSASDLQPAGAGASVPVIFNHALSARPGDIVGLQGENFGSEPVVSLQLPNAAEPMVLPLVNKFGSGWVSFRIPESATGALVVRLGNGAAQSVPVALNAARAYHLDALQIVPGGAFRIFGRNLKLAGFTPRVLVNGLPAKLDLAGSDEHMLRAVAPMGLKPAAAARITVDNGNGTGSAALDRVIEVVTGSGDPFGLGVGWAGAFTGQADKVLDVARDSRIPGKGVCGGADDTAALQAGVDLLAAAGGGVLQLPRGKCRLLSSLKLKSRVVLQGHGKDETTLVSESNYPVQAQGLDLVGLRSLTVMSDGKGARIESVFLKTNTRVFIQDVRFLLQGAMHMFLTENRNFAIVDSEFIQPSDSEHGPFVVNGSSGLFFYGNTTVVSAGSTHFARVHDAFIGGNRFIRDVRGNQNSKSVIHSLAMDFAHRIAVVGNKFDVLGGPVLNKFRNDGETLLTEGGGPVRTENLGVVGKASALTLSDARGAITLVHQSGRAIPENMGVAIVGGKGMGQTRKIVANDGQALTVDREWDSVPDDSSRYSTFVWGLEKSLLKGNVLNQNPRGIWLYQTGIREVDVVDNIISEGGGIYLRAQQYLPKRSFTPIYGVRIANNVITNTTQEWVSYLSLNFVRRDADDFGVGMIGIEVRGNRLLANVPNLTHPQEDTGVFEGFTVRMHTEGPTRAMHKDQTRLLGTIFQDNVCRGCSSEIRVRDGARATVLDGNRVEPLN